MLDRQPAEAVAAVAGADVDLLAGTNTEEGNLYLAPFGNLSTSTAADVDVTTARSHTRPARLVEAYRRARPHASAGELRSAIMGDALFGAGTRRPVDAHAGNTRTSGATYRYSFAWRSNALGGELEAPRRRAAVRLRRHRTAVPPRPRRHPRAGRAADGSGRPHARGLGVLRRHRRSRLGRRIFRERSGGYA
ncbi:hypothetical protein [Actinomadura sp. RB99]|uniref:hypothetical protein n=1 Tax=Actinomadura sp. RB99 TaxID=2691577 RepID=UPI001F50664B|nr:hypothetical protein [Actinomadura sp. RB99]